MCPPPPALRRFSGKLLEERSDFFHDLRRDLVPSVEQRKLPLKIQGLQFPLEGPGPFRVEDRILDAVGLVEGNSLRGLRESFFCQKISRKKDQSIDGKAVFH